MYLLFQPVAIGCKTRSVGHPVDITSYADLKGCNSVHVQWNHQDNKVRQPYYCKATKFSDARKFRCNLPKIQMKRPNLCVFCQKDANGIANSEDPDQTAPQGAV